MSGGTASLDRHFLEALLDFSDDALCFFNSESLVLVAANAAASKLVPSGTGSCGPSLQEVVTTALNSQNETVVDELLKRCATGETYTVDGRSSLAPALSAKRHSAGSVEGILVKLKPSQSAKFGNSTPSSSAPAASNLTGDASPSRSASPVVSRGAVRRRSSVVKPTADFNTILTVLKDSTANSLLSVSENLAKWDAFEVDKVTNRNSVAVFTLWCLRRAGLVQHFKIPEDRLVAFLVALQARYTDNPYHNRIHAADVTRSVHCMLCNGMNRYLDEEQQLALYIGAAAHDAEHGGLSNAFLCATNDPLAITYHNASPLENMHAAVLVRLLLQPSHNFLAHLPGEVFKNVRKYSVAAILCTDPAAHRQHMETWASHAPKWAKHVASVQSTAGAGLHTHDLRGEVCGDEMLSALGMLLKCADLGHMTQPFANHRVWVEALTEEFYQQGDREKMLGMQPLPFMNREKGQDIASAQVGFMSFYALPMFDTMSDMFPEMLPMTKAVKANFQAWHDLPKPSAA